MYLSTTDNSENEWDQLFSDTVNVTVKVRMTGNIIIPDESGPHAVSAVFRKMTCDDYAELERLCTETFDDFTTDEEGGKVGQRRSLNYQNYRREIIRRMLEKFSLFELSHKNNGNLTDKSFNNVMKLSAPLLAAMLYQYDETVHVSEDEEETIEKQAAILFSPKSRGVENACEAINLFCTLGNFAEKFKMNRFELKNLPYKEFVMLKMVVAKETAALNTRNAKTKKPSKISMGGRTMESRGIVVPDKGQY